MKSALNKSYAYGLLLISLTTFATPPPLSTEIDVSTIQIGQIVAENDFLYRKIIAKTGDNTYRVQNFYKQNHNKQSDTFIIKDPQNLITFQEIQIYNLQNLIFEGPLILWFINGNQSMSINVNNGKAEGVFIKYYIINGNKEIEGYHHAGKPDGLWKYWSQEGVLEKQVYYKLGIVQWKKENYQLKGF